MKRVMPLALICIAMLLTGCKTTVDKRTTSLNEISNAKIVEWNAKMNRIRMDVGKNGYIDMADLDFVLTPQTVTDYYTGQGYGGYQSLPRGTKTLTDVMFVKHLIEKDRLPFGRMFYLAVEKDDFSSAENIRRTWMDYLQRCKALFQTQRASVPYSVDEQLAKLSSAVGLTDPMLITLRKEVKAAMAAKDWDTVQKLQSIITDRTNELRPSSPGVVIARDSSGQQVIINKQVPSVQHHTVKNIPSYGFEDMARAGALLRGRGLSNTERGFLKVLDIFTGR